MPCLSNISGYLTSVPIVVAIGDNTFLLPTSQIKKYNDLDVDKGSHRATKQRKSERFTTSPFAYGLQMFESNKTRHGP